MVGRLPPRPPLVRADTHCLLHLLICTAIVAPPLPSLSRHRYLRCRAAATFLAARPPLPSSPRGRRCLPCRAAIAAFLPSSSRGCQPLSTRNAPSLPLPALLTCPPTQSSSAADTVAALPLTRCRCITAAANVLHRRAARRRRAAAHRPRAADALPPLPPRCRRRQRCAAAKLLPLPPSLTFQLSLTSPFLSPLPLPL
jgi:hypothetical protein